jgi:NADPH2 dehydrogenase
MCYPLLLSSLQIGHLILHNRIVMPPMVTFMAKDDGLVTEAHIEHYTSSVGPGLIIVEGTAVLPEGRMSRRQLGIYSDQHIEGLAQLARAIHSGRGLAGIQIHHAGITAFNETRTEKSKRLVIILLRLLKQQVMFSGLRRILEAFKSAASRAVEAGFDIIELHGAHGYLFSQLLSPLTNWRIDRYGGSLENRRRFLLEVYRAVDKVASKRALVTCRLGVADKYKRGFLLSEGLSTASSLVKEGIKVLDISSGRGVPNYVKPQKSPYSGRLHLAHKVKSVVQIPVIGGGRIRHPDLAEQALQDGMADMIFVGHGMLADPGWARKTIAGKPNLIKPCMECRNCFHFTDSSKCPARRIKDESRL